MSNACQEYGISSSMFHRACPGKHKATNQEFARIYITGLQSLVSKLDGDIITEKTKVTMLKEQMLMKDEMIEMLRDQIKFLQSNKTQLSTPE
jgi:hypothetical protein